MDKGAARSRKLAEKAAKAEQSGPSIAVADNPVLRRLNESDSNSGRGRGGRGGRGGPGGSGGRGRGGIGGSSGSRRPYEARDGQDGRAREDRPPRRDRAKMPELDEAIRYKPKAIRTSAALIWSEGAFEVPPKPERLEGVRRVDLSGSGITDVSWIKGGVTWLSLAGCPVEKGWEAIGDLNELSVLNISGCGLTALPPSLGNLSNLKAIVAMNNDWTALDDAVVSKWTSLNSLIVSHSPSLSSIPRSLSTLVHLSKLTFSHCASLPPSALPDLSALPLLRDVKMNNLPLLSSLPKHLSTWGTGDLTLVRSSTSTDAESSRSGARHGDGLEVLDLGNCSLPYSAIEGVFIPIGSGPWPNQTTWHLRSLSLHSNPLGTTHADYAERLQASPLLPNLQIIDAKRVVERKRKGEINESRAEKKAKEKREKKMKPSGANVDGSKVMRSWGNADAAEGIEAEAEDAGEQKNAGKEGMKKRKADKLDGDMADGKKQKSDKKRRREQDRPVDADPEKEDRVKRSKAPAATAPVDKPKPKPIANHTIASTSADPSAAQAKKYDPTAAPSAVLKVIDVKDDLTPQERKIKERREGKRAAKAAARAAAGGEEYIKQKAAREKEEAERKDRELKEALSGKSAPKVGEGTGWDEGGNEGAGLGVGGW